MHKSKSSTKFYSQMTDFQQSDLTLQLIKVLCVSNTPIHDMHLILSCYHMDRTCDGENNDKSVSVKVFHQPSLLCNSSPAPFPTKWPRQRELHSDATGRPVGCTSSRGHICLPAPTKVSAAQDPVLGCLCAQYSSPSEREGKISHACSQSPPPAEHGTGIK